jgi:hypothetical protein
MLRAMTRYWPVLEDTPGLAAVKICITAKLDPITGGLPMPTKWGLFCGWESREARDRFLEDPERMRPFVRDSRESWSVALDTVRAVRGDWHGWTPSAEGVEKLASDEPLAVITYAKMIPRHIPSFTWHNAKVVRAIAKNPAETMRIGLGDHPNARSTFSIWRSKGEMVRFSYGEGVHNPLQRRALDVPWGENFFFARFRPVR